MKAWNFMYMFNDDEKLMICTIGKVGYRDFRDLVNKMHAEKGTEYRIRYLLDKSLDQEADTLLEDPAIHKAIFYRDPLERFLSAFLSLCEGEETTSFRFCKVVFGKENITFPKAVLQMPGKDDDSLNEPFKQQHTHCGGITRELLDNTFNTTEQLTDLQKTKTAVKKMMANFKLTDKEFERFYPMKYAHDYSTGAIHKVKDYYGKDPRLVAVLIKFYLQDYLIFNMTVPLYAQKALQQLRFDKSQFKISDRIMTQLNVPLLDPNPPPPTQAPTPKPKPKKKNQPQQMMTMMGVRKNRVVSVAQLVHPTEGDDDYTASNGGADQHPNLIVAAVSLLNILIVVAWCCYFRKRISTFVCQKCTTQSNQKKASATQKKDVSAAINRRRRRRKI